MYDNDQLTLPAVPIHETPRRPSHFVSPVGNLSPQLDEDMSWAAALCEGQVWRQGGDFFGMWPGTMPRIPPATNTKITVAYCQQYRPIFLPIVPVTSIQIRSIR